MLSCAYDSRMDYIEFMLWKAGLLVLCAFIWGLYTGFNGCSLSGELLDKPPAGPAANREAE